MTYPRTSPRLHLALHPTYTAKCLKPLDILNLSQPKNDAAQNYRRRERPHPSTLGASRDPVGSLPPPGATGRAIVLGRVESANFYSKEEIQWH
jgi:hypothetical protein